MGTQRVTGFSLIELMVAMTVMAFLMMAVSPSVSEWIVNLRIRNATEALQTGLQTARNEAVRRNQKMTFWLISSPNPAVLGTDCTVSSTGGSWVVSFTTPASACNSAPSTTTAPMLVASHALGDGASSAVSVATTQSDGTAVSSVVFDGFGRISGAASGVSYYQIQVTSATNASRYRSLTLRVGLAGSVRMCDPVVSTAGDPRKC